MKIAVIGAGGFLGTAVLKELSGSNMEVIGISSQAERLCREYAEVNNIMFSDSLRDIPENTDVLLNCAFPRSTDGEGMALGLRYIQEVFTAASERISHAVINISSQGVYDSKRVCAADENTPLKLESAYAVGKFASELLADSICADIVHTNIRVASLIGPGLEQRVINKMVRQAVESRKIHVREGRQLFGYMDVRDAATAIIAVCNCAGRGGRLDTVYNLGSERNYTLMEIAARVAAAVKDFLGTPIEIICEESQDVLNSSLVCDRFYKKFNWRPSISMDETIHYLIKKIPGGVILLRNIYHETRNAA